MAALAPEKFLSRIQALHPSSLARRVTTPSLNPWYIVATAAYSASNKPEGVAEVFRYVLRESRANGRPVSEQFIIAQKSREAIFKSGLLSGYSRAINSLRALHDVTPDELREKKIQRNVQASLAEHEKIGSGLWRSLYGDTADSIQKLLDEIYPDMGYFTRVIGYGFTYGHTEVLSALETSYTLVAALIAADTPQQTLWHLDGARRMGATLDEVKAVRQIAIEVARRCGISWSNGIPEIPEKLPEER